MMEVKRDAKKKNSVLEFNVLNDFVIFFFFFLHIDVVVVVAQRIWFS